MSDTKRRMTHHETVHVPRGWKEQDKALIIQLNRIFDDVYNKISLLTEAQKESDRNGNSNTGS